MRICVNGIWRDIRAKALSEALEELGYVNAVVATAVNGSFVAAQSRNAVLLADNDQVEIVAPMQGG